MTEVRYDSEKYKKILKFHESNEDRGKEVPEKKKLLIFVDSNFTVEEKINMHYIKKIIRNLNSEGYKKVS